MEASKRFALLQGMTEYIKSLGYDACSSIDWSADPEDDISEVYESIDLQKKLPDQIVQLCLKVHFADNVWFITADDGYYTLGRKRPLVDFNGRPIYHEPLKALIRAVM
ncbi:hypothetical protein [Neptuniibacter sp. QD37_11]|uniref:hypothetical protein n=1 Tax=Neptuniibacter sp. QD37_11 TaxID=3398209 RepID=UPI0039F59B76